MQRGTILHRTALALYGLGFSVFIAYWAWSVYVHAVTPIITKTIISGDHFETPAVVDLPFLHNSLTRKGNYSFDVTLFYNEGEETRFLIVPDDCLRSIHVNGQPFDLGAGINYCDYVRGLTLDFQGLLKPGSNNISFTIEDVQGGYYGLKIKPYSPAMPSRIHTLGVMIFGLISLLAGILVQFWRTIKNDHLILTICLTGSVLLRLPYFWSPAHIDEGAFVMLGRDLLGGNLPYVVTFENKPPLVNVIFALFLLFSDSLPGARLMMSLYLGITAYTLYRIGVATNSPQAGMWSAGFSLLLFSVPHFSFDDSFRFVYTELLASLPLALILYYVLKPSAKHKDYLIMGACCAAVALIRTNMIIVALFVILILCLRTPKHIPVKQLFWFSVGVSAPYILLLCIYASVGHVKTLFDSMIVAPMAGFADAGITWAPALVPRYMGMFHWIMSKSLDVWIIPIIGILIGLVCMLWQRHWRWLSIMAMTLAVSVGVFLATIILAHHFDHYILQLVVPISLMAGFCVSALLANKLTAGPVVISIVFSLLCLKDNLRDGVSILNRWNEARPLQRGAVYKAGEFIRQQNAAGEPFFSYNWAELPFYTNATLVTMHVYPAIATYERLNTLLLRRPYNHNEQVQEILRQKPRFIAYRNHKRYKLLVDSAKNQGYQDVIDIDGIRLLKRP